MLLRLINFCWIVLIWANLWPFSRADKLHYWFVVKNWGLKVVLYMMVLQWFRRRIFWCLILHHFCYFTQNWFVLRSTFYHVALTFRSGFFFRRTAVLTTFATHLTQIVTLTMISLWKNESLFMTTILGRTRSTTALTYTIRLHYQIVISDAEFMYNFMLIRKSRVDCGCSQVVASQRGDARPQR